MKAKAKKDKELAEFESRQATGQVEQTPTPVVV